MEVGWQHLREVTLEVKQSKIGSVAYVPMTAELSAAQEGTEGRMVWLLTEFGRPHSLGGLGIKLMAGANAAGVAKILHRLRKALCIYWAQH